MNNSSITPQTVVRRSESILFSQLENEIVMMDIEDGNYYGLEEPGCRIWELTEEATTVEGLCNTLRGEYDVEAQQCENEVVSFIRELQERKVLEFVTPG